MDYVSSQPSQQNGVNPAVGVTPAVTAVYHPINIHDLLDYIDTLLRKNSTPQQLIQTVLDTLTAIAWLQIDARAAVFLWRVDQLVLTAQSNLPFDVRTMCAALGGGQCVCGTVAVQGIAMIVGSDDVRHTHCAASAAPHQHYCLPIVSMSGTVYGVLNLYLKTGYTYQEEDYRTFALIAAAFAQMLDRRCDASAD
ncbi:MAG: GAF domain-containing protein [Candidatus Omnitrophica bacterium]|nr:GAF domain-containing protein [Candidatus Omnitrophota bacterium]